MNVSDHAALDDGKFDLYLVCPGAVWQLLAAATHLKFGFAKPDLLKRGRATQVTLRTATPRPINVDGELDATTPATFGPTNQSVVDVTFRCLAAASAR